jgi:hypothetical protein
MSPFPQEEAQRYRTGFHIGEGLRDAAACLAANARPARLGFQDPNPMQCVGLLRDAVRAAALADEAASLRILLRRRHAIDPYDLPWQPRPAYVRWLHAQGRVAQQVVQEVYPEVEMDNTERRRRSPSPGPRAPPSTGAIAPTPVACRPDDDDDDAPPPASGSRCVVGGDERQWHDDSASVMRGSRWRRAMALHMHWDVTDRPAVSSVPRAIRRLGARWTGSS